MENPSAQLADRRAAAWEAEQRAAQEAAQKAEQQTNAQQPTTSFVGGLAVEAF